MLRSDERQSSPRGEPRPLALIAGATGYVGGRLRLALEAADRPVRCIARRPEHLRSRVAASTEVVRADCLDAPSLDAALVGVDTAYYLVHSMGSSGSFEDEDRDAARNFGRAAQAAGVRRIVYLGGLGDDGPGLSSHLRSRHETGRVLRESGVETIEFRASIVIGSGSLSFELIRALVQRLPVMICPRWVSTPAQPISIEDVVDYLVAAGDLRTETNLVFEIGGPDVVSYGDIMREYARQRGLRRFMISVPFLTPRLSSLWLGLITPLYSRVGRKLVESLRHPTVVTNSEAGHAFAIRPRGYREAIERALANEDRELAATSWSDAISASMQARSWAGVKFGSRLIDSRQERVGLTAPEAFAPIRGIGGEQGWYYANWLWNLRGAIDVMIGGVGMRRGRRNPDTVRIGDVIDCWRVEDFEPDRRLVLSAEMRLPGRAWLEFEVVPDGSGSAIRQTAIFDPVGLLGLAYWYGIYPIHELVFGGMLAGIVKAAYADGRVVTKRARSSGSAALALPVFVVLCLAAAALGGWLTNMSVDTWYAELRKPFGTPPDWIFAPVWTCLYLMMAIAAWMIWAHRKTSGWAAITLKLFALQLALNVAWSALFFAMRNPALGLLDIAVLWLAILAMLIAAWQTFRPAALLFAPYLAWVSYAAYLNAGLWYLNT